MKLTAFVLIAFGLHVSAKSVSQTITYSGKDISLETVFSAIEKQTGYVVFYDYKQIAGAKKVTLDVKNEPLGSFLDRCFKGQPFGFAIEDKTIMITKLPAVELKPAAGVLMPPGSVKGRVTNEDGEALAGASLSVKGTNLMAVADAKGYYIIENVGEGEYTLVVTYVGYKSATKVVKLIEDKAISINFEMELNPYGFNDVIISANLVASKKKEISSAVTIITAKQIEQLPISNISELFRSEVSGGNSWNFGPGSQPTAIKLRGDIDFYDVGSTVKIFIDGIEVVASASLSTLPLNAIDHIEVLHGPQASTLYGSGATSGVIYIFTKKGKLGDPHISAKLSAGTIASKWVDKKPYQQDHSLSIAGGNDKITYNFGGSYFHYDPYWPDGSNTNTSGFVSIKARQGKFTAEVIGQYSTRNFNSPLNPILKDSFPTIPYLTSPYNSINKNTEQILGLNMIYTPFSWWQHNFNIGIDQNNTSIIQTAPRYIAFYDTLNSKSNIYLSKKSYRYYTTLRIPTDNFLKLTLTAGFDHYLYEISNFAINGIGADPNFSPILSTAGYSYIKFSNTGYYVQAVAGFGDKVFLTTGVRSESTESFGKRSPASVAPRIGLSCIWDLGNVMIKPRAGYGKSIKVPDPSQFGEIITAYPQDGYVIHQLANPDLKPQEQTGYDIGFDAEFGKGLGTLEASYYSQNVNNFIVSITDLSNYPPELQFQFINVGKIKNRGLELAGTLNIKPLKFRFTYSITDSKVADVSNTRFTDYYQNGDRIWGIPKSSGGATITYTFPSLFKSFASNGGSINLGTTYFGEWMNLDLISQNKDYLINFDYSKTTRGYVINYSDYLLFRLGVNYNINKSFEAFLTINNLFNSQQFEYNNITPTQGRITMLGLRINY